MVNPYSMDLRARVVGAGLTDGMSARAAAARFGVSADSDEVGHAFQFEAGH